MSVLQTKEVPCSIGKNYSEESKTWDPAKVIDLDFELLVTSGSDTPVYRGIIDQTLLSMLQAQMITLEQYLENTTLPFADNLLASIRSTRQSVGQGQVPGISEGDPIAVQAAKADPNVMAALGPAMQGGAAA